MSSGDESIDIPDEIEIIEEVEGDNNNPIETIETGEETAQNNEAKDSDDEDNKKVVKPKRVVRNPQPKLNEQTLRTKKGLTALPNHFKRVKFKGRGHEAQDLNVLMKTYEYWCHRMFPKFPFDACIAKLETLGTKKGTQVILKKIRLGMEICDDDKKIDSSEEEQEGETPMTEGFVDTFDDRFDQLLSGTNGTTRPAVQKTTEEQLGPAEPEATEEQLERIRQNKLRAEALRRQRLEKMKANTQNQENPTTSTSSRNEISFQGLNEEVDFDNILSNVNKDTEYSVQSHLNDNSNGEEDIVSQKSSRPKRTQVISSDEKEMHVDSQKSTSEGSENINSISRKKIQTFESDDEVDIHRELNERHGDATTEVCTQDKTITNAMEEDNEEVDLDNILSIVNEDAETLVSKKSDGNGTASNKSSSDEEEKNNSNDNVNESSSTGIQRKKVQTIGSSDEMETDDKVTDTSADDIPKISDDFETNSTSLDLEDNLKEPFGETPEA